MRRLQSIQPKLFYQRFNYKVELDERETSNFWRAFLSITAGLCACLARPVNRWTDLLEIPERPCSLVIGEYCA